MNLRDLGDHYELEAQPLTVTQIRVDYSLTLILGTERNGVEVRLEAPFEGNFGAADYRFDPEHDPVGLAPALAVLKKEVVGIKISKSGDLYLAFSDGWSLSAPSPSGFESWTLATSEGLLLVGGPSEEVAIFRPSG